MRFRSLGALGCICLGLVIETEHFGHAAYRPTYRRDIVVCGKVIEAVIPEHDHTDVSSGPPFVATTMVNSVGVGRAHSLRLGETPTMNDSRPNMRIG